MYLCLCPFCFSVWMSSLFVFSVNVCLPVCVPYDFPQWVENPLHYSPVLQDSHAHEPINMTHSLRRAILFKTSTFFPVYCPHIQQQPWLVFLLNYLQTSPPVLIHSRFALPHFLDLIIKELISQRQNLSRRAEDRKEVRKPPLAPGKRERQKFKYSQKLQKNLPNDTLPPLSLLIDYSPFLFFFFTTSVLLKCLLYLW